MLVTVDPKIHYFFFKALLLLWHRTKKKKKEKNLKCFLLETIIK